MKCGNCEGGTTNSLCKECLRAYQREGLDGMRWRRKPYEDGLPEELVSAEEAGVLQGVSTLLRKDKGFRRAKQSS